MIESLQSVEAGRADSALKRAWKHLRIPYQLTLAPIFLWGYTLAAPVGWQMLPAFLALHFLLYPGITAYNSYYDRDQGPIGGLKNPPSVDPILLVTAVALKAAGLLVALGIGPAFAGIYMVFLLLSVLYSHPRFRWKANPWLSAAVVGLGQGGLGFLAGWAAARGGLAQVSDSGGALIAAICTTLGLYPLTQLFQMEEDSARGDRTLCVALGRANALRLSQAALAIGALAATITLISRNLPWDAAGIGIGFATLAAICEWLIRYPMTRDQTFRIVTVINYGASAGFALVLLARVAKWG